MESSAMHYLSSTSDEEASKKLLTTFRAISASYMWLLIIIGVPGNLLVFLVLRRNALSAGFLTTFLKAIAILNMLILLIGLSNHLMKAMFQFSIKTTSYYACFSQRWVNSTLLLSTNWIMVIATTLRFQYMLSSGALKVLHSPQKSCIAIVIIIAFQSLVEFVILYSRDIEKNKNKGTCAIANATIAAWIEHSIMTFIPYIFLMIFTVLILTKKRQRSRLTSTNELYKPSLLRVHGHVAKLMILTNIQFMITNMPLSLYYSFGLNPFDLSTEFGRAEEKILKLCLTMIFYTGYSVNIILYCSFGKRFRQEIKVMLCSFFCVFPQSGTLSSGISYSDRSPPSNYTKSVGQNGPTASDPECTNPLCSNAPSDTCRSSTPSMGKSKILYLLGESEIY